MSEENDKKTAIEDENKGRFPFLEIYYDALEMLPQDCQLVFIRAVLEYGLFRKKPDFSGEERNTRVMLEFAWKYVFRFLDRSWIYRENGKNGGAPPGNKNASKQPKTSKKQANSTNNRITE